MTAHNMLRIILTCNYSPWSSYSGGGQLSTHQLATELACLGHDVHVVYTRGLLDHITVPLDTTYNVHWAGFFALKSKSSSIFRPLNALTVTKRVSYLSQGHNRVVVHSQGEEGTLIPVLLPHLMWVLTPRYPDYPAALMTTPNSKVLLTLTWLSGTKYMLLRRFARYAQVICPTSQVTAKMIETALCLTPEQIQIVPNGIHNAFMTVNRHMITEGAPIVFFGRNEYSKGIDTLVDAYIKIRPSTPLVIIGGGNLRAKMTDCICDAGLKNSVRFMDWLSPDELAQILAGAALAVLPSRVESFGNAIAETIAAGTPLIATTAGSIPSIADSQLIRLVEAGDVGELAKAIEEVLFDIQAYEIKAIEAQRQIRERFSWTKTASHFVNVYENVLKCKIADN
ncbi:MAG: glycosyltransferase involved in cell wall biosynthesis [Paraglaciecola sp.]|jgi:glycosyltransferase involved in cell wall biosynthesis